MRGGPRNRAARQPDPDSGRSERRGLRFDALPNEGWSGPVPAFPLPAVPPDDSSAEAVAAARRLRLRERRVWREVWSTPQAAAWSVQPWRWPIIAEYCRLKTVVELNPFRSAALVAQLHRYRDQLGLTPAGMKENNWKIAAPQLGAGAVDDDEPDVEVAPARPPRRLRAVSGDQ